VLLIVSALSGVAVISTLFAGSALALMNIPSTGTAPVLIVAAVTGAAVAFNVRGVQWGVRVVELMTAAKLVPLALFVLVGAAFVEPANLAWSNVPDARTILGTSGIVIFAFMGIEGGLAPSGEVREPSRTVPRAAFLALLAVCVLYLAVQAVAQGILGAELGNTRITPLAAAAGAAVGEPGRALLLIGATVSMLGGLLGAGLVNPRIVYALARDGFLPRSLAGIHPVYRTPDRAIVFCALVVLAMALTGTFERLLVISNIAAFIVYALVALAALTLQRRDVRAGGEPFRCPGGPLVHILALAGVVLMLMAIITRQDVVGLGILVAVTAVAYVASRRRA
jgi:amino acid transporter